MRAEDYTTPWIEEVFADLDLIDLATITEPNIDAGRRDVVIGELPIALRRVHALTMEAIEDFNKIVRRVQAKVEADAQALRDSETQQTLHRAENYVDALRCIFRLSLCDNFVAWNEVDIEVARGWKVVVPLRAKIFGVRTPIVPVCWLVRLKEELVKISDEKILRPFRTEEHGRVMGNIRGAPGMQRLYTFHERCLANELRARADFLEAPRDNNYRESCAIAEWHLKQECVRRVCWESIAQLLDHPWSKQGALAMRPNWDVVWMPPVAPTIEEASGGDAGEDD